MRVSYPIVRLSYPIVRISYPIVYHVKVNVAGTVLFDRTSLTEQLLFYMSLQNIDELNIIQRVT